MINESFVKICLQLVFRPKLSSKSINESFIITIHQIMDIINLYLAIKKETQEEIPLNLQEYIKFLKFAIEQLIKDTKYDRLLLLDAFNPSSGLTQYIKYLLNNPLDQATYIKYCMHINNKYKISIILSKKHELEHLIESIENEKYDTINEIINKYEELLNSLYFELNLNKKKILDTTDLISERVFPTEMTTDKESLIEVIKNYKEFKQNRVPSIPSGMRTFDDHYSNNGFESGRIYIAAGVSGTGKSLWLLSSCMKSAMIINDRINEGKYNNNGEKLIYLFITAENQIFETLARTMTMILNKPEIEINQTLDDKLINEIANKMNLENVSVDFKYVSPYQTSTADLIVLIEKTLAKYNQLSETTGKKYRLAAIYLDYLDLIRPIHNTDLYRLDLGHVTMELKELSIKYMVPLITLTQVNDYNLENLCEVNYTIPRLDLLTESKKKVENADCVIILHSNWYKSREAILSMNSTDNSSPSAYKDLLLDERVICVSIIKNRGYKKGVFNIYVDFVTKRIYCLGNGPSSHHINEYFELPEYRKFQKGLVANSNFELPDENMYNTTQTNNFVSNKAESSSKNKMSDYFF